MGRGVLAAMLLAAVSWTGCGPSPEILAQRERLDADFRAQVAALDDVAARLQAVRAREQHWAELRDRHGRVSEIACEVAADHVAGMERHERKQRRRLQAARERQVARLDDRSAVMTPISLERFQ